MQLSSGKNSEVLLLSALVLALLFAVYYYVVKPKQEEATNLESSVSSLNSEITSIQDQITLLKEEQSSDIPNEFALRKKVPASREIDRILLNIEEVEYVSGSTVLGIKFNNYDSLVSESTLTDPNATEETTEETAQGEVAETEQNPVSTIATANVPTNLKLVTFEVDVASPNFEKLQLFIKEIERLERVMHIDKIDYQLPGEEELFAEDRSEVAAAIIQITTFYYE
ncbi:potassium transporter [Lysinibacillus sp. KU-BSD001]|uniref:potassium transporter n=1 Tax=Lysinibacillus sp. KU-BSD001 TaxID=3141328 RepID=UPI0036E74304